MNSFQDLLERQKAPLRDGRDAELCAADRAARPHGPPCRENEAALQRAVAQGFKTASQEQIFETLACLGEVEYQGRLKGWMAPTEAPVPRALAATGHRGIRDTYGVALIVGPSNGPLLLLLRSAITALAAGNCCVLKLSSALKATTALLLDLVPKHEQRSLSCTDRSWTEWLLNNYGL